MQSKIRTESAHGNEVCEIAEILAAGLMRAFARKSSLISANPEESSLHISPAESGHAACKRENDQ
jgi:hypothetical protein